MAHGIGLLRRTKSPQPDLTYDQTSQRKLIMHAIVGFTLVPIDAGISVSPFVSAIERVLEESGLTFEINCNSTNIEGEWDEVFATIKRCHEIVHGEGAPPNPHLPPSRYTRGPRTTYGGETRQRGQAAATLTFRWAVRLCATGDFPQCGDRGGRSRCIQVGTKDRSRHQAIVLGQVTTPPHGVRYIADFVGTPAGPIWRKATVSPRNLPIGRCLGFGRGQCLRLL